MSLKHLRVALVAAAVIVPAHLSAQQTGTPAPAPVQAPAATDPQAEIQQIQTRLRDLQVRVLAEPVFKAAQDSVGDALTATMERLDPNYKAAAARTITLKQDVAAAQAARDNAKLTQLATEAGQLQQTFATDRERAMQDPEMQTRIKAFQQRILTRMNEIDPQTQQLLARLQELTAKSAPAQQQ